MYLIPGKVSFLLWNLTYDANLKDYNLLATTRGNCEVPHRCSRLGQTAVSVKGNKYSNSFPVAIKERSTIPTFKTQLKPCTFDHLTSDVFLSYLIGVMFLCEMTDVN